MPTGCEASGTIVKGDAVCVTGWNAGRAVVKRATRANLVQSKTVYGVAQDDTDPLTGIVQVLVAGEVADDSITNLTASAGWTATSRIVATDINQAAAADQCKLAVVDRPDGSEHVVGTCDENGHLAIVPRASRDASAPHVFNVKAYGAVGDGVTDDSPAVRAALEALGDVTAADVGLRGRVWFPPGNYFLETPVDVEVRCIIEGTIGGGVTITCPDWSSAFVFRTSVNAPNGGSSDGSRITNIDFIGSPSPTDVATPKWEPDQAYTPADPLGGPPTPGDRILAANVCAPVPNHGGAGIYTPENYADSPYCWERYFECIFATGAGHSAAVSGIAGGTFAGLDFANAHPWQEDFPEAVDQVIKVPGVDRVFFACTAVAGGPPNNKTSLLGSRPDFEGASPGDVIVDNDVTWTAFATNEPDWRECSIDDSQEWTAGLELVTGAVVRVAEGLSRTDAVFMCINAGGTTSGGAPGDDFNEPANAMIGSGSIISETFTDGDGIEWEVWPTGGEPVPTPYVTGMVVRGEKVTSSIGQRYVCRVGGNSAADPFSADPNTLEPLWTDINDGTVRWRRYEPMNSMIFDGDVVWSVRTSNAIRLMAASVEIETCAARTFPNAAFLIAGDLSSLPGATDRGKGVVPASGASQWKVRNVSATQCGLGVLTAGGDANGGTGYDVTVTGTSDNGVIVPEERGIADRAFLGNRWYAPFVQNVGGPGFWMSNGASSGLLVGGYFEATGVLDVLSTTYTLIGASVAATYQVFGQEPTTTGFTKRSTFTGVMPPPMFCRELRERGSLDEVNSEAVFRLSHLIMQPDPLTLPVTDGWYAWAFGRLLAGWWAREYHGISTASPYLVSSATAAEGYGLFALPRGFFAGESADRYYTFPSVLASQSSLVNAAQRNVGDRRVIAASATPGGYLEQVVTTAGYTGSPWTDGKEYFDAVPSGPFARPGDTVVPTDTSQPHVFVCTIGGTSDGPGNEPGWAGQAFPGGFIVEATNVRWDYLGSQAVWTNCTPIMGASLAKGANYTLVETDAHVTFTAGGQNATLPATPFDGEVHSIKSGGGFTTTIQGNGNNIDGSGSYAQASNGECTRVRFSAAVGQWEKV